MNGIYQNPAMIIQDIVCALEPIATNERFRTDGLFVKQKTSHVYAFMPWETFSRSTLLAIRNNLIDPHGELVGDHFTVNERPKSLTPQSAEDLPIGLSLDSFDRYAHYGLNAETGGFLRPELQTKTLECNHGPGKEL
jgi:hypothetical protein